MADARHELVGEETIARGGSAALPESHMALEHSGHQLLGTTATRTSCKLRAHPPGANGNQYSEVGVASRATRSLARQCLMEIYRRCTLTPDEAGDDTGNQACADREEHGLDRDFDDERPSHFLGEHAAEPE